MLILYSFYSFLSQRLLGSYFVHCQWKNGSIIVQFLTGADQVYQNKVKFRRNPSASQKFQMTFTSNSKKALFLSCAFKISIDGYEIRICYMNRQVGTHRSRRKIGVNWTVAFNQLIRLVISLSNRSLHYYKFVVPTLLSLFYFSRKMIKTNW